MLYPTVSKVAREKCLAGRGFRIASVSRPLGNYPVLAVDQKLAQHASILLLRALGSGRNVELPLKKLKGGPVAPPPADPP